MLSKFYVSIYLFNIYQTEYQFVTSTLIEIEAIVVNMAQLLLSGVESLV